MRDWTFNKVQETCVFPKKIIFEDMLMLISLCAHDKLKHCDCCILHIFEYEIQSNNCTYLIQQLNVLKYYYVSFQCLFRKSTPIARNDAANDAVRKDFDNQFPSLHSRR